MAITYTNQIGTVMDSLEKLLEAEFNLPVSWDEPKGTESFVLTPDGDDLIELHNNAQTRNYTITILYVMAKPGKFENVKSHLTKRAERVKRLIMNNTNYSPSGSYKWQEAKISAISFADNEEQPDMRIADMTFECIATEVI